MTPEALPGVIRGSPRWGPEKRLRDRELFAVLAATDESDPGHARARAELVASHLPLVKYLVRPYRDRGEPEDDLLQVGTIGLIQAIDRFEPGRGVEFSSFATPTILGEIKRHFRDRTWSMKVGRQDQDLQSKALKVTDELTSTLNRSPTIREIAAALDVTENRVLDAIESRQAYATLPLDGGYDGSPDLPTDYVGRLGAVDPMLELIENRETLKSLLAELPERERSIVIMRFFQNRSQAQIAEECGISQMHVSRLLARALLHLREGLAEAA